MAGIEAGGLQQRRVGAFGLFAVRAHQPHEPLRHDTVERRDEVMDVDAHVRETTDDIEGVVGVNGREHEVAGERRLHGDLGRFRVADLADHDLVRVVAQDGSQPAREGQPFLLVDRDLHDAIELIFHRVFDGDDLVLAGVQLGKRGVERGGLAAAGRAGHEHHAIGFVDGASELAQDVPGHAERFEAQVFQALGDGVLVENADHHVFAVHRRQHGDAEIDLALVDAQAEAAVLWHALLGDVEFGHDLQARHQRGMMSPVEHAGGRVEHAVDAVLHHHAVFIGLDVDVAGALGERVQHQ